MKKLVSMVVVAAVLSGCASSPNSISPMYVSPITYQNYSCDQIRSEMERVGSRVSVVSGQQQRAATTDAVAMTVGLVIFWPALFLLAMTDDKREELSRLRGEYEALQQAGTTNNCFQSHQSQTASTPNQASPNSTTGASPVGASQ